MNPERVIVTLVDRSGHSVGDYELPADAALREYEATLLMALAQLDGRRFGDWRQLHLETLTGQAIRENDTLASRGIWDGGVLTVVQGR